ncbi:MAG: T9SS type A sorting domain-containing protein [Cytophagaceae bacterium]|nr:T9SS type A sorting domain-containing protein [Cytophagaceae bacterium]
MKIRITLIIWFLGVFSFVQAATTSWTGTISTNWSTAGNWTGGVPTTAIDVVIGDASFTGSFQPVLTSSKNNCKSLTIGSGIKISTLSMNSSNKNLIVWGDITIGSNGSILHSVKSTLKLTGNWVKTGTYTASNNSATVSFAGTTQTITGTTSFRKLTINAGSTTTTNSPLTVSVTFTVSGFFDPNTNLITLTGAAFNVSSGGGIKVKTATLAGNYSINPTTIGRTSTIEYASALIPQTVSALSYGTLIISGGTVKTAAGSFTLQSSVSGAGNIQITTASTFDISTFTVNRGTTLSGGALTLANSCTLRVAVAFPLNFSSYSLEPTSTTEYYGANQTIYAVIYGHLNLSSASGTVTKTFSSSPITIIGSLTTSVSAGTLTALTAAALTINGNVSIGSSTTFSGLTFSHAFGASFANSGTVTATTGTFTFLGLNASISGTGTYTINNLTLTRSGITAAATTSITLSGNLTTLSPGAFQHLSGGTATLTMNGTGKTISGLSINLYNVVLDGTISTVEDLIVTGNLTVNATKIFTAAAGKISMTGASKVITNNGTLTFFNLDISSAATITTATSFFIKSNLSVSGALSASAGTVTFNGTSILSGSPNLFNVTINGTILILSNYSVLGIANAFAVTAGAFDVTTSTPNTVNYNGSGAQSVLAAVYNRLTFSTGGTKTASGNTTCNDNITINAGVTFNGSTFTHSIYTDWFNYGMFTASSSTVQFLGATDSYITGATTFNNLTLNKSNAAYTLQLINSISVAIVNMTIGEMRTGLNAITITTTRTDTGIILGTITRTHAFGSGIAYAFESAVNTITFQSLGTVTSVTVTVTLAPVTDFPYISSVNREYNCSIAAMGVYMATLRLHYLDSELEGNDEASMTLWKYSGSWSSAGKSVNDATANWVEYNLLTNIVGRWTLGGGQSVVQWTGALSTNWGTAGNWQSVQGLPSIPPGVNDIVLIGSVAHTNQPVINSAVTIRSLRLYSVTASSLTLASGSFSVGGSVLGTWTSNAIHSINVGAQTFSVGGDLTLSNGTALQVINLTYSTGTVTVGENLTQSGGASITAAGAGNLAVAGNFNYVSGTFVPATSTMTYNGVALQAIAPVSYYNLTINKSSGTATNSSALTLGGNLTVSTGGQLSLQADLTVAGQVTIGASTIVDASSYVLKAGGNLTRTGTFVQGTGTVEFNGTGDQNISATEFNKLIINKASGIAYATGNITVNGDATIQAGTLDIATYNLARTTFGGTLTLAPASILKIGGASNAPSNFSVQIMDVTSTVEFNGAVAQSIPDLSYGNIVFTNGGSNAKSIQTLIKVANDLTINSGATLNGNGNTITISGNWQNNSSYVPALGTLRLLGSNKILGGTNTFYNVTCIGSYSTVAGTTTTVLGLFTNSGTFVQSSDVVYYYGSLLNNGSFTLNGITNVMGLTSQTLANNGTFISGLSGVVNYNGNVSTLIYSTNPPQYATVNVNNTAGITAIQPWTVVVAMTIGAGATFNGGGLTHVILGSFTNNGTVINNGGTFRFSPSTATTINFGTTFSSTGGVTFTGAGAITIVGSGVPEFGAVLVSNTNAAGITPSSNWNVISGFTVQAGSVFHGGASLTLSLYDAITVNGIFDGGTSSVVMNDVGDIGGVGDLTFNHLTINSTNAALIDFNVTGNFIHNGAFGPTDYTVTFSGNAAAQISGTVMPVYFNTLEVAKTASLLTLLADIYAYSLIDINAGSTVIANTQTINLEGDWNNNGVFSEPRPTSTVNFIGTFAQVIDGTSNTDFGHVTLNNAAGLTLSTPHTINGTLTLTAGTLTSNGNLNQNLYFGAISGTGSGLTTGNIRFFKTIWGDRYHYISTPIGGLNAAQWNDNVTLKFSANSNLYWYDETVVSPNQQLRWTAIASTSAVLNSFKGYALFFPRFIYNTMFDVTGVYTHGATFSSGTLTNTASGTPASDGWNLLGNPYPSTVDWDAAVGVTRTGVNNAIYMWDGRLNRYVTYVTGVGTNGGTKYIGSMQGFYVKVATSGGTGSVTLTNSARVTSNLTDVWRVASQERLLRLSLSNGDYKDETIIRFSDRATENFDGELDAYKLMNDSQVPSCYSFVNSDNYAINSLSSDLTNSTIPIKADVAFNASYTFHADLSDFEEFDSVIFVDKLKGVKQDLKITPEYTCDLVKGDTTTRFYINYKKESTVTETNTGSLTRTITVSAYEQKITVKFTGNNLNTADVSVYNIKGNEVYKSKNQSISNGRLEINLPSVNAGIYIVKIESAQGSKMQEVYLSDKQ